MKRKTLIILLVVPFIISLLTFASVRILEKIVPADIVDIVWNYNDHEGFKLGDGPHKLEAEAVINEELVVDEKAKELVWTVKKVNNTDDDYLSIYEDNGEYYLKALKEGTAKVVCSNKRGSISKHFLATVYEDGAIIINNKTYPNSGSQVDDVRYFGEYDFKYDSIKLDTYTSSKPTFTLDVKALGAENNNITFIHSNNIVVDNSYNVIIQSEGRANIIFTTQVDGKNITGVYEFTIINDAYNIYNYDDLLMATNFSSSGHPVVLQTNLLSLSQLYKYDATANKYTNELLPTVKNSSLFGHYDFKQQKYNFENEIYVTESTYNVEFIKQYNQAKKENNETNIKVGIRLQNDLYGNGFTINQHGLAYPNHGTYPASHGGKLVPTKDKDYFFGPLPFVTIGTLNDMPVVKAYGQDNVGLYIDGNDISVNDIKIRNTDEVSNMLNLHYTGSVIDVNGKDVNIKNSIISNGRTVVRAFSSDGLVIENCILKNANEFLLKVGNNEYNKPDHNKTISQYVDGDYQTYNYDSFIDERRSGHTADKVLEEFVSTSAITNKDKLETMTYNLLGIQDALDNLNGIVNEDGTINYGSEVTLKKTYFSNSGMFSIAFDTLFNGAYLYNGMSSTISTYASMFNSVTPNQIGGTSYPVKLNLDASCRFYDYKDISSIDVSSLIEENISALVSEVLGEEIKIGIDDFFPIKKILHSKVNQNNYVYRYDSKDYINTQVAFYGGGYNLSTINIEDSSSVSKEIEVDILNLLLTESEVMGATSGIFTAFRKAVILAAGFHPFRFYTNGVVGENAPQEFGKTPQVDDLYNYQEE